MKEIETITRQLRESNEARDWAQYHNGKDLALALSIEASELNAAFLWKAPEQVPVEKIREELADVFLYAFILADKYGLDVREICEEKIRKNGEKYPVDRAKGNCKKYNEL